MHLKLLQSCITVRKCYPYWMSLLILPIKYGKTSKRIYRTNYWKPFFLQIFSVNKNNIRTEPKLLSVLFSSTNLLNAKRFLTPFAKRAMNLGIESVVFLKNGVPVDLKIPRSGFVFEITTCCLQTFYKNSSVDIFSQLWCIPAWCRFFPTPLSW